MEHPLRDREAELGVLLHAVEGEGKGDGRICPGLCVLQHEAGGDDIGRPLALLAKMKGASFFWAVFEGLASLVLAVLIWNWNFRYFAGQKFPAITGRKKP